jgi:hypothetical protein
MGSVLRAQTPEPSLYGLVNPKTVVDESERWTAGFEQESISCMADVRLLDACDTGLDELVIEKTGTGSLGVYTPFNVQAEVACSTMGKQEEWVAYAIQALEMCQNKAVELEFWEGRLARAAGNENRFLANGDAVDVTPSGGTPVRARYGLALLEGRLAAAGCGGRGFIHTPVSIASVLPVKDRGDGVLTTTLGNYLIAGDGYTGTGTDGAATTGSSVWLYATGPVFVRFDDIEVAADEPRQYVNTETNEVVVRAERAASVVWDGCAHFKVLVDLSLDYA